ncbi:Bifunctional epoxide hydrolase 2 [Colletotrichum sp. SAR 10_70]|nr:Bifunctional epoxide hydrolase 2 [Colletotrichum sp. SAR 10_70]KAI8168605.1 Bifunctional epoxide hydrolase 2 [Colletotrichum sp. SAR 10_71]KAI8181867.1 Bifunctional epoxide hydrolase 2 [Colletotrichum sp. SAR 10_75]KAI8187257.1 Bifunctional epoxide hydrolase 2 [Colletotrichum sp. SAR 10_65]KAI8210512.1 Bifunctional epoxide hydrolase 2 [Colletotrichum sp. SAR 10_76]KAI8230711.1 Bifunctional epoxide hydrolase 2 [Colletotrichum sp. SAR 10_86]KAI8231217.1 Bifunctional epoxide hydrolase 2 [Coll
MSSLSLDPDHHLTFNMAVDKIAPNDPRIERKQAEVRGKTYSYLYGKPEGTPKGTVVLIHGFPDISLGWRYQIPFFLSQGYQVVAPDCLGYGQTASPEKLEEFSLKSMADDIKALSEQVAGPGEQIILGGHDWGGALVWRVALWHPSLIKGVFSVCTPYNSPTTYWFDLADLIAAGKFHNFKYQLQLRGADVEAKVKTPEDIRQFLQGIYGGRGPNGELVFTTEQGVVFENLGKMGPTPLLSEDEIAYYAEQFSHSGLRGPLNWYRTRKINYEEELPLAEKAEKEGSAIKIQPASLFILANKDAALPASMAAGMDQHFVDLTRGEVTATHWALWEAPEEVNKQIKEWLDTKVNKPTANL